MMSNNRSQNDFLALKMRTNGLLDPKIYSRIHELSSEVSGDIVEVGTAQGAATIAAALGAPDGVKIYTVDKIAAADWSNSADVKKQIDAVINNFEFFGVKDKIVFIAGRSEDLKYHLDSLREIGMLILDADGAIDRDFSLYFNELSDNAAIVIDDYRPNYIHAVRTTGKGIYVDQKFRLTALFIEYFEEKGLIARENLIKYTYFGRKVKNTKFNFEDHTQNILSIYRKLTFSYPEEKSRLLYTASNYVLKKFPRTHFMIKTLAGKAAK